MDVGCEKCGAKFKIPDQKLAAVPKGQSIAVGCPKCKNKISVTPGAAPGAPARPPAAAPEKTPPAAPGKRPAPAAPPAGGKPGAAAASGAAPEENNDAVFGNPFDFLEDGAKTALVCEPDEGIRKRLVGVLKGMGYHLSESASPRDALKQLRGHDFHLIVLNESFGTPDPDANHMLKFLDQMLMSSRRNIFVTLLTRRFKTMDSMMTYNKSVNMIVNLEDLNNIEKILERGLAEYKAFFRVLKDSHGKVIG